MTPQPRTIDLGELPRGGGPGPAPDRTARRGRWRPWLATAVGIALASTAYADSTGPPSWATLRFTATGQVLAVDQHTVYLLRQVDASHQALARHRLADGGRVWEVVRETGQVMTRDARGRAVMRDAWFMLEQDHPLYVTTSHVRNDHGAELQAASTTGFDPRTGRPRWSGSGVPVGLTAGDLLLLFDERAGRGFHYKTTVNLATGQTAWRLRKSSGYIDYDQRHLANRGLEGYLTTYDVGSGEALTTVRTAPSAPEIPQVLDDLVLLWQRASGAPAVAYDLDGLARRWTRPVPADSVAGDCRSVVCFLGPDGVVVLDPDSGTEMWSFDWPDPGIHLVQELAPPWPEDHLLLHAQGRFAHDVRTWIVDARTGTPVLDLTGWHPPVGAGPDRLAQWRAGGRTWFGRLSLDPPGVDVLGSVGPTDSCHSYGPNLACQVGDRVEAWLVRR